MATIEERHNDAGETHYRVKVRLRGHRSESGTFRRLTDAKRWAQSTEAAMREGRHFKTAEAKRHTLADLINRYAAEVLASEPKNASNTRRHLNWWKDQIGSTLLSDVTAALITAHKNKLLAQRTRRKTLMSPSTVVRHMASLSHALNVAVKDWEWLDDSPMRKVSKPRQPRGRERFLSEVERQGLLLACRESESRHLYAIVVLALSTGMRRGEIMGLRWGTIDFELEQIRLHDTKNGTSRSVPLVGHAKDVLIARKPTLLSERALLFPGTPRALAEKGKAVPELKPVDIKKPWSTAVKRAGLTDFRFHDLRHSAASYLAMNGASTVEIAAVLGHKTLAMVKRYSHLGQSHTRGVVQAMNDKIFGSDAHG